ncbi:MAG TPA: alpha/beta fold hydrolase, partial [Caldilineaceae bacterium]|nr:alpha/beta fold hydrolase [Caldilineaceae bacterium]
MDTQLGRPSGELFEPLFEPHRLLRNADVQTMLSRYRPRDLVCGPYDCPLLLDAGEDQTGWGEGRPVRMHGYYTPSLSLFGSRGLVLVLHGWEGSSHSVYNLVVTDTLIRAGYDVFRLNVRDHGPGLHLDPYALNRGFFMGTLLDEIVCAVSHIAEMSGEQPFFIVGASMGGNLALRLAIRHASEPFPNLQKVVAFNPALDPQHCAEALDARPNYRRYFRSRWLRSLLKKQALFPELYDFTPLIHLPTLGQMTDWVLEHYGDHFGRFASSADYYRAYSVLGDAFHNLTTPTTIITAANDPVVPIKDFYALTPHPLLDIQILRYGGHVGYIDLFPLRHNLPRLLMEALRKEKKDRLDPTLAVVQ